MSEWKYFATCKDAYNDAWYKGFGKGYKSVVGNFTIGRGYWFDVTIPPKKNEIRIEGYNFLTVDAAKRAAERIVNLLQGGKQ